MLLRYETILPVVCKVDSHHSSRYSVSQSDSSPRECLSRYYYNSSYVSAAMLAKTFLSFEDRECSCTCSGKDCQWMTRWVKASNDEIITRMSNTTTYQDPVAMWSKHSVERKAFTSSTMPASSLSSMVVNANSFLECANLQRLPSGHSSPLSADWHISFLTIIPVAWSGPWNWIVIAVVLCCSVVFVTKNDLLLSLVPLCHRKLWLETVHW